MGRFVNPDSSAFQVALNSKIYVDKTGLIEYTKWNQNAQTALQQIKNKKYPASITNYTGKILLVGINYDKGSKEHQCKIEEFTIV